MPMRCSDSDARASATAMRSARLSSVRSRTLPVKNNQPCGLDGTVSFTNVSGKFFQQQVPFDHLVGVVAVSNNDLSLQEMSAVSGGSRFKLEGDIKNFQQAPLWNLEMRARFRPQDRMRGSS